jgi:hypothetical protein
VLLPRECVLETGKFDVLRGLAFFHSFTTSPTSRTSPNDSVKWRSCERSSCRRMNRVFRGGKPSRSKPFALEAFVVAWEQV